MSDLSKAFSAPPPAAPSMVETPEFQAAVAAAVAAAIPAIRDQLALEVPRVASSSSDQHFAESLAMSIAQLTDQGRGPRPVAPELIKHRAQARKRMEDAILAAQKSKSPALYRLQAKIQFGGVIEPKWVDEKHKWQDTEIEYDGIPNEAMVPLNDTAMGIHAAFMESIGSLPKAPGEEYRVIGGGLVVKSGTKQGVPEMTDMTVPQGLKIRGQSPGKFIEKNILGTIAPPAIEMA